MTTFSVSRDGTIHYEEWERKYLADYPFTEIDEERFNEMLNILPPLQWHTTPDGVNVFCMCEFWSGNVTQQYARMQQPDQPMRYFSKAVRYNKRDTYISRDEIIRATS